MNDKKKVNKKSFGLKVKKLYFNLVKKIKNGLRKMYTKFMDMPKKTRMVIGIWGIVVVLILIVIIIGSANNKFLDKYKTFETKINDSALNYVKENKIYPLETNKLKLDFNALIDEGYLGENTIDDKTCRGFAIVYVDGDVDTNDESKTKFNINSYIHCGNYTTKGYSDYK